MGTIYDLYSSKLPRGNHNMMASLSENFCVVRIHIVSMQFTKRTKSHRTCWRNKSVVLGRLAYLSSTTPTNKHLRQNIAKRKFLTKLPITKHDTLGVSSHRPCVLQCEKLLIVPLHNAASPVQSL